jgi:hypothetical protein
MEQGILAGEQGTPPSLWKDGLKGGFVILPLPAAGRATRLMCKTKHLAAPKIKGRQK